MSSSQEEPILFIDCVDYALRDSEFMSEYRRVFESHLGLDGRSPIERLVDDYDPVSAEDWQRFLAFIYDAVWLRLPPESRP